ncbi:MAG: hypothetical protein HOW73_42840 [Polyangiaceae bacterium]|nr:hypothetical protein [Polyangiaceae bacterium]
MGHKTSPYRAAPEPARTVELAPRLLATIAYASLALVSGAGAVAAVGSAIALLREGRGDHLLSSIALSYVGFFTAVAAWYLARRAFAIGTALRHPEKRTVLTPHALHLRPLWAEVHPTVEGSNELVRVPLRSIVGWCKDPLHVAWRGPDGALIVGKLKPCPGLDLKVLAEAMEGRLPIPTSLQRFGQLRKRRLPNPATEVPPRSNKRALAADAQPRLHLKR